MDLFKASTEARYRVARTTFDHQDEATKEVIRRIQDRLSIGASGYVRVWPGGNKREERSELVNVGVEYLEMNALYVATEILKDLAMLDVRVENFEFPSSYCAECGVKLNQPKRKKKKK
jgi:hypothetical protein